MAIKALIKIFDDETGKTYLNNYLVEPTSIPFSSHMMEVTRYDFQFHFNIMNEELLPKPSIETCDTCARAHVCFPKTDYPACEFFKPKEELK